MATPTNITRRALLSAAPAALAALPLAAFPALVAVPAVAAVTEQTHTTEDRLTALARKFADEAMAIDPSIVKPWLGADMTMEHRGALLSISFERRSKPRKV
jgi:hypothetical protein